MASRRARCFSNKASSASRIRTSDLSLSCWVSFTRRCAASLTACARSRISEGSIAQRKRWAQIYLRKRAQGKPTKQALIVVAVKLLHTLYAMLKHRRPYNPSRLLVAAATIGT